MIHKLNVNNSGNNFYGLKKIVEENKETSIFVTHGMGVQFSDFADPFINKSANELGFILKDTTIISNEKSFTRVLRYQNDSKVLKFYVHCWFPATANLKFFLDFTDNNSNRLQTMDKLKGNLMNLSVSDVIMYKGRFGETIRKGIEGTLKLMIEEHPNAAIVGVSESLGSKMFIDVLNKNIKNNEEWAQKWESKLNSVYMFSNQLSLLYLGDVNPNFINVHSKVDNLTDIERREKVMEVTKEVYSPLINFTKDVTIFNSNSEVQLIAFSDSNDLLSYKIPENIVHEKFKVVNVLVSVAKKGYSFPFKKPEVVNPIKSHLGYKENKIIFNYFINGNQ
ncbi:hypothetical protein [Wenyingzhuangia sp. IMCC45574]